MVGDQLSYSWLRLMGKQGRWAFCRDIVAAFAYFVTNCTDNGEVLGAMDLVGTEEQDGLILGFWQLGLTHME